MNRLFDTVPTGTGIYHRHYAVRDRETRKVFCADLELTWDQADRLCDVFEEVARQRALDLREPGA